MRGDLKGELLLTAQTKTHGVKLDEAEALPETPTGRDTARIGPFFGPSAAGYRALSMPSAWA